MRRKIKKQLGFTLIELMVVVVILGILATLAVPRYNRFVAKSRQSEAKTNLGHIAMLEDAYRVEYEEYVNLTAIGDDPGGTTACTSTLKKNLLGFRPSDCTKLRYKYDVTGATSTAFVGAGSADNSDDNNIYPGCTEEDRWRIDQTRTLTVGDGAGLPPPGNNTQAMNAVVLCED